MITHKLNNLLNNTEHEDINHVIGKYIKKNLDSVCSMTIDELAQATYVSQAKISKFIKTLGYENFIAFKDDCMHMLEVKKLVLKDQRINLGLSYLQHVQVSLGAIEENLLQLDETMIENIVQDIREADDIYLYGIAYSNMLCQYFQYESDFVDKKVIVIDEMVKRDYKLKENSLLIMISVDGHSLSYEHRGVRKILKYPVKKWIMATSQIPSYSLELFDNQLVIPSKHADGKDRRIMVRYMIDVIIGRYQYLYK